MNYPLWINNANFSRLSTEELTDYLYHTGLQGVEINVPTGFGKSLFSEELINPKRSIELLEIFNGKKLKLTLAAYENILGSTGDLHIAHLNHLLKIIRFAYYLGGEDNGITVNTFAGFGHCEDDKSAFEKNLQKFEHIFSPIIKYAEELNVRILFENCPMEGWSDKKSMNTLNNLAATLGGRKLMYESIPSKFIGEVYDPSHDIWQLNDPLEVLKKSDISKIGFVHLKSTKLKTDDASVYWGNVFPMPYFDDKLSEKTKVPRARHAWNRFHYQNIIPGMDENDPIDWKELIRNLNDTGFHGAFIIEPPFVKTSTSKINSTHNTGIQVCKNFIGPIIWEKNESGSYAYNYTVYKPLKYINRTSIKEVNYNNL